MKNIFGNKRVMTFVTALMMLLLSASAAFAQTPELMPDSSELITAASSAMTTWNLWSVIIAFAIAGLALWVARRVKSMGR